MSGIALAIRFEQKRRKGLADVPSAIARGLNEGGDRVRTQVQRALKQQTGVKAYRSITSRVNTKRAGPAGLSYAIIATGKGIPIKEFPVRDTGHGIVAEPWAAPHLFQRSFAIPGRGVDGFRMRLGSARFPIRKFYGPALPKELGKGIVPAVFLHSAQVFVPPAILKHLAKAWG